MFNTKLPIYGIFIILSLILNVIIVLSIYKKHSITQEEILGALVYENIGIVFGAKLLTYFQNLNYYQSFDLSSLELSSYGAVIGAIFALFIFKVQFKTSLRRLFSTFFPTVPLMYAIGKIGCFLVGCCYGIEYRGFGSVAYNYSQVAPNNIPLFPIQIIETVLFTLIFSYLLKKSITNKFNNQVLGNSFILCSLTKFFLDYLRMSHKNTFISFNQLISIIFFVIGIVIIINSRKKSIN